MKLKTLECNGVCVDIHVDGEGNFSGMVFGETLRAISVKALEEQIRSTVRDTGKIAVDAAFLDVDDDEVDYTPIVLIGIHASNHNVLYRDKHNATKQIRSFYRVAKRLSKTELAELKVLMKARAASRNAVVKWVESRQMNPVKAIEKAQAAAMSK